jgi:hypothetical protein
MVNMNKKIQSVLVLSMVLLLFTGVAAAESLGSGDIEFLNGLLGIFETFFSELKALTSA